MLDDISLSFHVECMLDWSVSAYEDDGHLRRNLQLLLDGLRECLSHDNGLSG